MWTKSFSRYTRILLVSAAVIIGAQISISLWQLESTELFSGNVFLSGLRNPFFSLLP